MRSAEAQKVSGKWHFVFETEGGDREFDSLFEQNETKVSGKWGVREGKEGDPVQGTFADNKLALEFTANSEEVGPGRLKIDGTLGDDGALSGNWSFQDYSGTFKATRVKDEAVKPSN
jgi:hypothetical protein